MQIRCHSMMRLASRRLSRDARHVGPRLRRAVRWLPVLLAPWLAAACDGCGAEVAETASGGSTAAGGSGGNTTSTTTTIRPDEGTQCVDAVVLEPPSGYVGTWGTGRIAYPGDRDFFRFDATEGQWLALMTNANPDNDPGLVNPVLTLWSDRGEEQLAENDNAVGYPKKISDAEIIYRVPRTGSYCLQVWEYSDWADGEPVGDPSFSYDVGVLPLDSEHMPGFTLDADPTTPNDTAATAQSPMAANAAMMFLAGLLEPVTDEDFYEVRFIAEDAELVLWLTPGGPTGGGATVTPGSVSVVSPDGDTVLARVEGRSAERRLIYLPLPSDAAKLTFRITRPAGELGSNDFYLLKHYASDTFGYEPELDDSGNDDPAGAEWPDVDDGDDDDEFAEAWLMGTLGSGDADYWAYDANAGDLLNVRCFAQRHGSGLRDMHVALFADTAPAVPLAEETETDLADLFWTSDFPSRGTQAAIPITETGTYLLRVDLLTGSQDPEVVSDYYRCRMFVTRPPEP